MGLGRLDSKLNKLKDEIKKLEKEVVEERKKLSVLTEEQRVADYLHDVFCHHNHTDGCGWFYDDKSWTEFSRKEYLSKSKKLLKIYTEEEIYEILRNFKSCEIIY